ncbi:MAG: acetyltransferase [Clostridium sp.]|nr:acetyltransferase [Clostridium sp.]
MKNLYIIGASGHGKVVADVAACLHQYNEIFFLDDDETLKEVMAFPVVGKATDYGKVAHEEDEVIVAIGNVDIRKKIQSQYEKKKYKIATLIHPHAIIGMNVSVEQGTIIMAGAVVNADTKIGRGCIINTCASVDHDCRIDDYVHVSVGAHICGSVSIGEMTWIGAGATVSNNITVCDRCMLGAGAVAVKDIVSQGTYVGVPVRMQLPKKRM